MKKAWCGKGSGKYCCLPGCTSSQRSGIRLYKVPNEKDGSSHSADQEWASNFHQLLRDLKKLDVCDGYADFSVEDNLWRVRCTATKEGGKLVEKSRHYTKTWEVVISKDGSVCAECMKSHVKFDEKQRSKYRRLSKLQEVPIKQAERASRERLEQSWSLCQTRISDLESLLEAKGVTLGQGMANFVEEIASNDNFLKEWWETQLALQAEKSKFQRRFPPSVVRYCLKLYAKSPAAYKLIRKILILPSPRTLNTTRNKDFGICGYGFQTKAAEITRDAVAKASKECDRYVVLALDEMTIKEELIYQSSTNAIIGLVDYENEVYTGLSKSSDKMATHILAAYMRGITNKDLDGVIACYPTAGIDSSDLFFLLLDLLVEVQLQTSCIIEGIVFDGLSANRTVMALLGDYNDDQVPYRMKNPIDTKMKYYDTDDQIYVKCEPGYYKYDEGMMMKYYSSCMMDGSWDKLPKCKRMPTKYCKVPDHRAYNHRAYYKMRYMEGEYIKFECDYGYYAPANYRKHAKCMKDGNWDGAPQKCKKYCMGDDVMHGYYYPMKMYYRKGERVQYRCKSTYQMSYRSSSYSYMTCMDDGNWDNKAPMCNKNCMIPRPYSYAYYYPLNKYSYSYGEKITFYCSRGYRLDKAYQQVTCGRSGKWMDELPKCVRY